MDNQTKDELMHYGVLGMKWGHHRAKKKGGTYTYTSHTTKKYNKKAKRASDSAKEWDEMANYAESKGKTKKAKKYRNNAKTDRKDAKKYSNRAKRSAQLDAKEQAESLKVSTGKTIAARMIGSSLAINNSKAYHRHRALGSSKASAMLKTALGGTTLSMLAKAEYIRKS